MHPKSLSSRKLRASAFFRTLLCLLLALSLTPVSFAGAEEEVPAAEEPVAEEALAEMLDEYDLDDLESSALSDEAYLDYLMDVIEQISPVNDDMAAAIDAMPDGDPDDTWAVYVYMNGSDLESQGRNHLNDLTELLLSERNEAFSSQMTATNVERILDFVSTIQSKGAALPTMFTNPDYSEEEDNSDAVAPSSEDEGEAAGGAEDVQNDAADAMLGMIPNLSVASMALYEMMNAQLSDNVKIVVQTGGTKAWSMANINPNMMQRFELGNSEMKLVDEGPLVNMGDPDNLSDFLNYCKQNYPADNTVLILWDHGGEFRGFGWDEIHADDNITIEEMREGICGAYLPSEEDPPLDLIYLNACLCSATEVVYSLRGLSKYMVSFEEVGYAGVPFFAEVFDQLVQSPEMNPAKFGRLLADSFLENITFYGLLADTTLPTCMSVMDVNKAARVYEAYGVFAKQVLLSAIEDPSILSALTAAANSSIFFALTAYKGYNTIDLYRYMEGMLDAMPAEAQAVMDAIDDAVIYFRGSSYQKNAKGLSIYFPAHVEELGSLQLFLNYVTEVCENDDLRTLYYYLMAGCLNSELENYVRSQGYGVPAVLDYSILNAFKTLPVEVNEENQAVIALTEEILALASDAYIQMAEYEQTEDGSGSRIVYLGEDRYSYLDEDNRLVTNAKGNWVTVNGVPFHVSLAESTSTYAKYQAHVLHNGEDMYLMLYYDAENKEMEITGLRKYTDVADTLDRNVITLSEGDELCPVYPITDTIGCYVGDAPGETIVYGPDVVVADSPLPDGAYIFRVVLESLRSDKYYSNPVIFTVENGEVTGLMPFTAVLMASNFEG